MLFIGFSFRLMLGNFNFRRPNPSGHEEHVDRNAQPVECLALPSTTLAQRFSRVGMDRGDTGEHPRTDLDLSLAPAGWAAVAETFPGKNDNHFEWVKSVEETEEHTTGNAIAWLEFRTSILLNRISNCRKK